ncbi:peptidoglycan LD-endopeptidase LytH [Janthinobacterium sp. CG_23.3]|uniref:M23 family metallopeptidase n=1 Tax=Janthinobacterium sp. CG_23.3 TaxID=3349634 RepID=UPI0038D42977
MMRKGIFILLALALGAGAMFFFLALKPHSAAPPVAPAPLAVAVQPPLATTAQQPLATPAAAPQVGAVPQIADPSALPAASTTASTASAAVLQMPVEGVTFAQLSDTFNQPRPGERRHEALDIMAPKGAKVLAAADGKVAKLFISKPGGVTLYQFDASEKFAYYYAHLDRYAPGVVEGKVLKRGELLGYVGTTGNADPAAPHLHFAVFELEPAKEWWKGAPQNPYPLLQPVL